MNALGAPDRRHRPLEERLVATRIRVDLDRRNLLVEISRRRASRRPAVGRISNAIAGVSLSEHDNDRRPPVVGLNARVFSNAPGLITMQQASQTSSSAKVVSAAGEIEEAR